MTTQAKARPLFDPAIVRQAVIDSFRKLTRGAVRNPVMFVVYVGSILTTLLFVHALLGKGEAPAGFILAVSVWLWFTVLFANFAEAMAEGRGKAQAEPRCGRRAATSRPSALARPRARGAVHGGPRHELAQGRCRAGRGRGFHPGRRRGDRGHRLGGRERHHRRERAGHPRERRRPQRGHRRHAGALRLADRPRHGQPRRDASSTA